MEDTPTQPAAEGKEGLGEKITDLDLPEGVTAYTNGLVFAEGVELSIRDWKAIGTRLGKRYSTAQWLIADWWVHGEHKYGARARKVAREGIFGLTLGTLMNMGTVARKVETSRRHEALSFEHHSLVAKLAPEMQSKWLGMAEGHGWSTKDLDIQLARDWEFHKDFVLFEEEAEQRRALDLLNLLLKRAQSAVRLAQPAGVVSALTERQLLWVVHENAIKELIETWERAAEACSQNAAAQRRNLEQVTQEARDNNWEAARKSVSEKVKNLTENNLQYRRYVFRTGRSFPEKYVNEKGEIKDLHPPRSKKTRKQLEDSLTDEIMKTLGEVRERADVTGKEGDVEDYEAEKEERRQERKQRRRKRRS
jgi:hypothetical protein